MLADDRRFAYGGPKQSFREARVVVEYVVDEFKRDQRHGSFGDGCNRIQGSAEEARLQSEDLSRQDEIHNLTIAVVKDLIAKQPAIVIDIKHSIAPACNDNVLVLMNLSQLTLQTSCGMETATHGSVHTGRRKSLSRELSWMVLEVPRTESIHDALTRSLFTCFTLGWADWGFGRKP